MALEQLSDADRMIAVAEAYIKELKMRGQTALVAIEQARLDKLRSDQQSSPMP